MTGENQPQEVPSQNGIQVRMLTEPAPVLDELRERAPSTIEAQMSSENEPTTETSPTKAEQPKKTLISKLIMAGKWTFRVVTVLRGFRKLWDWIET